MFSTLFDELFVINSVYTLCVQFPEEADASF